MRMPGSFGLMRVVSDPLGGRRIARIEHDAAIGRGNRIGKRGAPGARADHRHVVAVTSPIRSCARVGAPLPCTGALFVERPARARGLHPFASLRPSASRSAPAQAIIAPLSVQSSGGGSISVVPACAATCSSACAHRAVGGDAAGGDQRRRRAELVAEQARGRCAAGRPSTPAPPPESRRRDRSRPARSSGRSRSASCRTAVFKPDSEKFALASAEHRPRKREARRIAVGRGALHLRSAGISAGRAVLRPCRTPRRSRRRRWCRAAHSLPTPSTATICVCPPEARNRQ